MQKTWIEKQPSPDPCLTLTWASWLGLRPWELKSPKSTICTPILLSIFNVLDKIFCENFHFESKEPSDVCENFKTQIQLLFLRRRFRIGKHALGGIGAHLPCLSPQTHLDNVETSTYLDSLIVKNTSANQRRKVNNFSIVDDSGIICVYFTRKTIF